MSSHNKTRAEKKAVGLVELSAWIEPTERDAIRTEAAARNMSVPLLVAEWAKKLAKTQARRNRQDEIKSNSPDASATANWLMDL